MTAARTRRVPCSVLQLLGQYELVDGSNQAAPVAAAGTAARAAQSRVRKSRATFSAIAMVVSIVTLDGGVGMIDASDQPARQADPFDHRSDVPRVVEQVDVNPRRNTGVRRDERHSPA